MRFVVKSASVADFNAWLDQVRGTGSALDEAGYAELAKPSKDVPPTTYRSVEAKLFEHIVDQTLTGSAGHAAVGATPRLALHQAGG
jgi:cytochrome o ubiquinol oxidase subunit 2